MEEAIKYELIEKYLAGILSEGDKLDFENQMASDAALRAEVALHRQLEETLQGEKIHQFRAVLKKTDQEWSESATEKKGQAKVFSLTKILAVAAAFLLMVMAYHFLGPRGIPSDQALFAQHFEPYRMILNQRTAITETEENREIYEKTNQAVAAYERRDFVTASTLFQQLQDETPDAGVFQLYIAVSELALGNADKAIPILAEIVKNAPPLYIEQSRWYLALAYLQKGDKSAAKIQLDNIQPDAFKYSEAQVLSKALF